MSTPTIKITITEPGNSYGTEEPPMLVRAFEAPNEPLTCSPGSYRSREEKQEATSTAVQLEGFLRGAGYMLPSFLRAEHFEARLATALRDEQRSEALRETNQGNAARWKQYAELLEAKIKRAGLRLPKGRP